MLGRAAYQTPWELAAVDTRLYGEPSDPHDDRAAAVLAYRPYVETHLARGERLHAMTRHLLGLFKGEPRARAWRQILAQGAIKPDADWRVVEQALAAVA
jgi:tRNA-dihydrouridine synthase A